MQVIKLSQVPKKPHIKPFFTGQEVTIQGIIDDDEYFINIVHFGRGVRSKFHSHDVEQILIVTAGTGIVATEEEEILVTVGDIISFPKSEKHWHGATSNSEFSHLAVVKQGSSIIQLED